MYGRKIRCLVVVLATLVSFSAAAEEQPLGFYNRGKLVGQWSLDALRQAAPAVQISVWEPHEDRNVTYEGFEVSRLFQAIYGDGWKDIEEVLFTCADGYQPSLPTDRFKRYRSFLAYRRLDLQEFKVQNRYQNESDVPLGPYYLVWDNLDSEELRAAGASGWPYQVVGVDLVDFADRFPKVSPPKGASQAVRQGFITFREHCMPCHTVNGEGGGKAPELNYPTSVTEYLSDAWIRRWMMDPRSIRYNATMPTFASHPDPDVLAEEVLAYLKTMAGHKQEPK